MTLITRSPYWATPLSSKLLKSNGNNSLTPSMKQLIRPDSLSLYKKKPTYLDDCIINRIIHAFWLILIYDVLRTNTQMTYPSTSFILLLCKTNRFHVTMSVNSNILLKTPKGGKTISDTLSYALSAALFVFWPQFDIICDLQLLLYRCTPTWNLFIN